MAPKSSPPRENLTSRAYDTLEEMIVTCALKPGRFISIPEIQEQTGLGRTPIHLAINRLAGDTLLRIRPRHGLQIAPVDLARDLTLLQLRREMERFVVRLAIERGTAASRARMRQIAARLRADQERMDLDAFNRLDRKIDTLFVATAGEAFLEHTLRPLHTTFRRTGWLYHSHLRPTEGFDRTIESHIAQLEAAAAGKTDAALDATNALMDFVAATLDDLSHNADPALFDCNLEPDVADGQGK
jgi:DNA-binding GntR family transcriptional regulator